jgi:hypothetical protein
MYVVRGTQNELGHSVFFKAIQQTLAHTQPQFFDTHKQKKKIIGPIYEKASQN